MVSAPEDDSAGEMESGACSSVRKFTLQRTATRREVGTAVCLCCLQSELYTCQWQSGRRWQARTSTLLPVAACQPRLKSACNKLVL